VAARQYPSITLIRGGRPLRLANTQQRGAFFHRSNLLVDFVVVDTPPGEVELVDAALRCADLVVVPVEPSPLSLTGLCDVADLVRRQRSPPALRSLLTRAHRVRISTRDLAERVEMVVRGSLCRTMIPEDARVVDSPDFGLPVTLSHRRCRASVAYRELVDELYPTLNGDDRTPASRLRTLTHNAMPPPRPPPHRSRHAQPDADSRRVGRSPRRGG
jgi:cellulose biosynthesis protein BcsQ